MLKLRTIKKKRIETPSLAVCLQSLWRCARALNLPAGRSAGFPPEHRACHEREVQRDSKQKAMGTQGQAQSVHLCTYTRRQQ